MNIDTQKSLGLVESRWIRPLDYVAKRFQEGVYTLELDIRFDSDLKPWVSHATGARYSILPPFIHDMSSKQMENRSRRRSLEDSLREFGPYKDRHRLILEIKSLGSDNHSIERCARSVVELIQLFGVEGSVSVASISPMILMSIHRIIPELPLILNGGIVPGFSFQRLGRLVEKGLSASGRDSLSLKIPNWFELVVASGKVPNRSDGHGTQIGYLLSRIPDELLGILQSQRRDGLKQGGIVSLSLIHAVANAIALVPGCAGCSFDLREFYTQEVKKLGLGIMSGTWGRQVGSVPSLHSLDLRNQIVSLKSWNVDLIYTDNPEAIVF